MLPKPAIRVSSVVYDDSIWVSLTNCFDRELEVVTHPCEKEDHSLFVGGRVGQPWIIYLLPDVVSGLGRQKEAAWALVQYLSDRKTSKQYMLKGGLAPRQSAWADPEVVKALDPEFLETGRASAQINYPGVAPLSITNVSKARDYIGQVIVTAIQGGNVKAALDTAFSQCADLLKEERAKKS